MPKTKEGWIPKQHRPTLHCRDCNTDKPPSEFPTHGTTKSGYVAYHSRCSGCYNKHAMKLPGAVRSHRRRHERLVQPKREIIDGVKVRCAACGYDKCKQAMDLHHIDGNTKSFSISQAVLDQHITIEMIEQEIKKCVVLCSNCHREHHAGIQVIF
jgi:hypothetical protein